MTPFPTSTVTQALADPARCARALLLTAASLAMAACGGGNSGPGGPAAPSGLTAGYGAKSYHFSWPPSSGATRYELFEDPDGAAGPLPEVQIGGAITSTSHAHSLAPQLLHERINASYRVRACNASGCGAFTTAVVPDVVQSIGYFKASNSDKGDGYGASLALSADGSVLAVGAPYEGSKSTGLQGDQADNSVRSAGAVYVFTRSASGWSQQAYIKASNTRPVHLSGGSLPLSSARFGASVSLSYDGNTLAVGAPDEASNARGVNGEQENTQTPGAGAVFVFTRSSDTWSQKAYIKASNTSARADVVVGFGVFGVRNPANFGSDVSLSADGRLLAVGAPGELSNAPGIDGNQEDTSAAFSGAVYLFGQDGDTWSQKAYVKASNPSEHKHFGHKIALAANGRTLAVGARGDSSGATGINGDQADVSQRDAGSAYVFSASESGRWSQQAYVKAGNTSQADLFGSSLALSADGDTLAVGAWAETSNATGVNSASGERSLVHAGAAYVFKRSATTWSQQAYIKPGAPRANGWFGWSLTLSADGNTLVVGAMAEASSGSGFTANQADSSAAGAGAAYIFQRSGSTWLQKMYVKASNTDAGDLFGASVALSANGSTLAVGAQAETSLSTGIQSNQADNSGGPTKTPADTTAPAQTPVGVGAVYLY